MINSFKSVLSPVFSTNGHLPDWCGSLNAVAFDESGWQAHLRSIDQPCYVVSDGARLGITHQRSMPSGERLALLAAVGPLNQSQLGSAQFRAAYDLKYAYAAGAMANGISSAELVIALGQAGLLASFGAAGLTANRIEAALQRIQTALPNGPYAFNLIHSPSEEALERNAVELYLKQGVRTIEASAFLALTTHIVHYRAAGLSLNRQGEIEIGNKVIAKVSRREVATHFLSPAPSSLLQPLVAQGLISEAQAQMAQQVPMCDALTVEADSGGHTDNRPLNCLLPSLLELRDELRTRYGYSQVVYIGAAGGIGTPASALGAFTMGADYIVTGSVNQACVESGASAHTKRILSQAGQADVMMAPAADMFEMGVKVQVLKKGTLFPVRAQKLYELYKACDSLETIPTAEREKLEKQIFRKPLDTVWQETEVFFRERDPEQLERAHQNPKRKMALVFRWYLGLSSRWSNSGEAGRELDYQIWCGPAMGAFNEWTQGTALSTPENRHAVDVAEHLMLGAAYLYRLQHLRIQGVSLPASLSTYKPE
ncbi:MAG: PfaD family polyunsaturated fatty acid/polyketide biosynthesis protein [Chloroflexi bacterium]|nr:PfaD family polyunsaturated fatty acid/polyketide biosynthesis protein [Chloroflexota bacterium]